MQETWVPPLGWEDPLEEGMATHSSILTWRIPRRATVLRGRKESDQVTKHNTFTTIDRFYGYKMNLNKF